MVAVIFHMHHEAELEWKIVKQGYDSNMMRAVCGNSMEKCIINPNSNPSKYR